MWKILSNFQRPLLGDPKVQSWQKIPHCDPEVMGVTPILLNPTEQNICALCPKLVLMRKHDATIASCPIFYCGVYSINFYTFCYYGMQLKPWEAHFFKPCYFYIIQFCWLDLFKWELLPNQQLHFGIEKHNIESR